jgi:hypothetical protein
MSGDNAAPHAVSLARMLLDLFSASAREKYMKRRKAGQAEQDPIMYPTLVSVLASTPSKLGEAMSTDNIADGLLGRMLFAEGDVAAARQRNPERFKVPEEIQFMLGRPAIIAVDQEADEALWQMTLRFDAQRLELLKRDDRASAALMARRSEKVRRICGTLASFDHMTVTLAMVEWAEKFCAASDAVLLSFAEEHLDKSKDIRDTEKVLAAARGILSGSIKAVRSSDADIIKRGFIPRSMCLKASHLSKNKFDLALGHLCDVLEIEVGNIEGRDVLTLI